MDGATLHMARELDSRTSDGIRVRLLWLSDDDRLVVAVDDGKTGEQFLVEVRDSSLAMHVFRHPYAYEAWRAGIAPDVVAA